MAANSEMKNNLNTMMGVIKNLVPYIDLYSSIVCIMNGNNIWELLRNTWTTYVKFKTAKMKK